MLAHIHDQASRHRIAQLDDLRPAQILQFQRPFHPGDFLYLPFRRPEGERYRMLLLAGLLEVGRVSVALLVGLVPQAKARKTVHPRDRIPVFFRHEAVALAINGFLQLRFPPLVRGQIRRQNNRAGQLSHAAPSASLPAQIERTRRV